MRRIIRCDGRDRGQAIVEVALVVPFLMILLLGAIDLGRLAQVDTVLASAARAGAQYGSLNLVTADDAAGMRTAATNDAPTTAIAVTAAQFCTCYGSSTTVTCTATPCSTTHRLLFVTVTASATFNPIFHFTMKNALALSRTATLEVGQ
jgi:Flp pilus assembly protein TadG